MIYLSNYYLFFYLYFQLQDNKCIQSWSTRTGKTFTSPAIRHAYANIHKYIAVENNNTICTWDVSGKIFSALS
jgi:hypothetical protein